MPRIFLKIKTFRAGFEAKQALRMTIAWLRQRPRKKSAGPDGCASFLFAARTQRAAGCRRTK
jgi:hypothetical protein